MKFVVGVLLLASAGGAIWGPSLEKPKPPTEALVAPTTTTSTTAPPVNEEVPTVPADPGEDLFAEVNAMLEPQAIAQFHEKMASSREFTNSALGAGLLSNCHAAALAAGAGGALPGLDPSSCGACSAAGVYLQPQMSQLLNPTSGSLLSNPTDGQLTAQEWSTLTEHQREALLEKYPELAKAMEDRKAQASAQTRSAADCQSASAAEQPSLLSEILGSR